MTRSSLYRTTKESLAFIKITLHAVVISITCALFNVDRLANFQRWGNLTGFLEFHIAFSEIFLTAFEQFFNLSLIKLCSASAIKNKRCLFVVSKIYIIRSNRRTPEFIIYQLWTSYKIFLSLKYLFHFFGWLYFFVRVLKGYCILLSWHVRVSE